MKTIHPFKEMKLKVGDEVWVRARIVSLPKKGTMGWANGMLVTEAVTHGLCQDPSDPQTICTDVKNIKRTLKKK